MNYVEMPLGMWLLFKDGRQDPKECGQARLDMDEKLARSCLLCQWRTELCGWVRI